MFCAASSSIDRAKNWPKSRISTDSPWVFRHLSVNRDITKCCWLPSGTLPHAPSYQFVDCASSLPRCCHRSSTNQDLTQFTRARCGSSFGENLMPCSFFRNMCPSTWTLRQIGQRWRLLVVLLHGRSWTAYEWGNFETLMFECSINILYLPLCCRNGPTQRLSGSVKMGRWMINTIIIRRKKKWSVSLSGDCSETRK